MEKTKSTEELAQRIFTYIMLGLATEIVIMVYLGFYS